MLNIKKICSDKITNSVSVLLSSLIRATNNYFHHWFIKHNFQERPRTLGNVLSLCGYPQCNSPAKLSNVCYIVWSLLMRSQFFSRCVVNQHAPKWLQMILDRPPTSQRDETSDVAPSDTARKHSQMTAKQHTTVCLWKRFQHKEKMMR